MCDHVDNFARSSSNHDEDREGPVVDSEIHAQIAAKLTKSASPEAPTELLPDLVSQVREFVAKERTVGLPTTLATTVAIYFGTWDIWRLAALSEAEAMIAVQDSIITLFVELEKLLDAIGTKGPPPTVIIPKVVDPTWLPRWFADRSGPAGPDTFGMIQRQATDLTDHWHFALTSRADRWTKGHIVVPDFNQWLLRQMRGQHSFKGPGHGSQKQEQFQELRVPCMNRTAVGLHEHPFAPTTADHSETTSCDNPERYLFW